MYWAEASHARRNLVRGNTITGVVVGLNDDCWGDLACAHSLQDNTLDGVVAVRDGSGSLIENNRRDSSPQELAGRVND